MKISINHAFELWDKYYLPEKLRSHSSNVAKVAVFITSKYLEKDLITKEQQLRIIISALLHDLMKPICKTVDFNKAKEIFNYSEEEIKFWQELKKKYSDLHHEEIVYIELKDDYPLIANIVKSHGFWTDTINADILNKLLAYSDLRANGNEILSIEKRILYLHIRYKELNETSEDWLNVISQDEILLKLEDEIFSKIDAKPEDCNKLNSIELNQLFKQHNINKIEEIEG